MEDVDRDRSFVAGFEIPRLEAARKPVAVITAFTGRYMMSDKDEVCVARGEKKSTSSIVSNSRVLPL